MQLIYRNHSLINTLALAQKWCSLGCFVQSRWLLLRKECWSWTPSLHFLSMCLNSAKIFYIQVLPSCVAERAAVLDTCTLLTQKETLCTVLTKCLYRNTFSYYHASKKEKSFKILFLSMNCCILDLSLRWPFSRQHLLSGCSKMYN